jgi:hypothetical protein
MFASALPSVSRFARQGNGTETNWQFLIQSHKTFVLSSPALRNVGLFCAILEGK